MSILFLFLDGVGLGENDVNKNPFSSAHTPTLDRLLSGKKLLSDSVPHQSSICSLLGIDAQMGVAGLPQSATSQATLVTGINFAKRLGYHYGPKPNPEISSYFTATEPSQTQISIFNPTAKLSNTSIFSRLIQSHYKVSLLNAYPDIYFNGINSNRHIHSVIPLAANSAGVTLFNQDDLFLGKALSADFTGQGWHDHLDLPQTPILNPFQAGEKLSSLSRVYDFSFFEFWESDYIGHKQDFPKACHMIEIFDLVLDGLLNNWDFENDVILITSDHGNLEDLSTRKHTINQVPALLIGNPTYQQLFFQKVKSIGDITPVIIDLFSG